MLRRTRTFFHSRDVLEVDTPALSRYSTSDPNIDSLAVAGNWDNTLYLQSSPESFMKRLLAGGYPDIYAICRVFRDGEAGRLHQPEFTMVEWYRHGFGMGAMIDETLAFIADILERPELLESESLEYETAFQRFANIDPFAATTDQLADTVTADAGLCETLGDDRDAWLDLLLCTQVAPRFPGDRLTVLRHFRPARPRWRETARRIAAWPTASKYSTAPSNWPTASSNCATRTNSGGACNQTARNAAHRHGGWCRWTNRCSRR
jgi:lysyl-tRNA synthetase class 2